MTRWPNCISQYVCEMVHLRGVVFVSERADWYRLGRAIRSVIRAGKVQIIHNETRYFIHIKLAKDAPTEVSSDDSSLKYQPTRASRCRPIWVRLTESQRRFDLPVKNIPDGGVGGILYKLHLSPFILYMWMVKKILWLRVHFEGGAVTSKEV